MEDYKEIGVPQEEEFRAFLESNITENINHARHVETEIHTFTGIYMAVVAGVLAFNFSGRDETSFQLVLHLVILFGGLLAMFLLNRWYTAFDTFMAYAEALSYLSESLILGRMRVGEANKKWQDFTVAYDEAVLDYKVKSPKKTVFNEVFGEGGSYDSHGRYFAFAIPRAKGSLKTRNFIFGFHGVILISVAIIVVKDLYSLIL